MRLHPLAIVVALSAGAVVTGSWGALPAVPVAASANAAMLHLTGREDVQGNPRMPGDRTAPTDPPPYAPLPFLGIVTHVAAVRGGGRAAGEKMTAHDGRTGNDDAPA